jgi:hypothetical protein
MIDLKKICTSICPSIYDLSAPFSDENYTYATNGFLCLRVARVPEITAPVPIESIKTMQFSPTIDGKWSAIPKFRLPDTEKCTSCGGSGRVQTCEECDGTGEVGFENAFNDYEFECKSCRGGGVPKGDEVDCKDCDGTGAQVEGVYLVDVFDRKVSGQSLALIYDLPGVELFSEESNQFNYFRFDGGVGIFMGVKW